MDNNQTATAGIDVPALEREIRSLWQQKAEESLEQQGQEVTRACVLNLIAYAPRVDASEIAKVISAVTSDHPSRSLVLLSQPEAPADSLSASVSSLCHSAGAGRQQVCSEQILVTAAGKRVQQLPSAVRPLLVSDLETALWWRAEPDFEDSVFQELVELAYRVILDSAYFSDPSKTLPKMAEFVQGRKAEHAFSDLAWSRLSPFRRQLAAFYDVPEYRSHLDRLGHMEIVCGRRREEALPVQALLVAAWFTARLGWKPLGKFEWPEARTGQVRLDAGGRPIQIVVKTTAAEPGLESVQLVAGGDPTASFRVSLSQDRSHVQQEIRLGSSTRAGKIQRYQKRAEDYLLARELEVLGHDRVYEQSLAAAPSLV